MDFEERAGLFFWGAVIAGAYGWASCWLWPTDIADIALSSLTVGLLLKTGGSLLFGCATLVGAGMIGIAVAEWSAAG